MDIKEVIILYNTLTSGLYEVNDMMVSKANELLKNMDFSVFDNVTGRELRDYVRSENKFKNYHLPFTSLGKKIFYDSSSTELRNTIKDIVKNMNDYTLYTLIIQSVGSNDIINYDDYMHTSEIVIREKGYMGEEIEFIRLFGKDDDVDFPNENTIDIPLSFVHMFLTEKKEELGKQVESYIGNIIEWVLLEPLKEIQKRKELENREKEEKEQKEINLLKELMKKHPKIAEELSREK